MPGVDAIVVGCADLTHDLGAPLCFGSEELLASLAAVRRAAEAAGVVFGVAGLPDATVAGGAGLVITGSDLRLVAAARARAAAVAQSLDEGVGCPSI